MTGLVRRSSRRRNMPSSSIHCCYIIFGSQVKRKHILEQDELFCCAIIRSGLIEKKKKKRPFLFLENARPLSSPWESWIGFSSLGTPEFLSTCLRIDSLTFSSPSRGCLAFLQLLPLEWYHVHILGYWYFSWQSLFQLVWILNDILWTDVKGTGWQ